MRRKAYRRRICVTASTLREEGDADTMSFKATTYDYRREYGWNTIAVAEVATGAPTVLKGSKGTNFEDYTYVHTWTVKGLERVSEGSMDIESVPFIHQNYSKWCMILTCTPKGLHLNIRLKKCEPEKILRVRLKADEILPSGEKRELFPHKWYMLGEGGSTGDDHLVREVGTLGEDINENEITLECEVCMRCITHDELPAAGVVELQSDIVRAVDEMLHKEVLTDFELHAGGAVLKAHRALLSVRSPYFAAMLQPHTKEAKEGSVQMSDVKPEVLKQVLLYIYTGVAPALKDMPWDLLIAADKYQLQQLKRHCETHIASSLTVDNAAATATNASIFSCDILWDRAVVFIKHNLLQVMRSPGWAVAIAAHPEAIQRISELMG